ncbi:polyhydroxyalkanoic acid system family protein [Chitinimonas sp. PSY-7]|uniref:polyhydroxyalkanoic acid system family protein n=1 Tax=Chitinimonas sp. PSY-7 TaxID=3459088 RepID=UPI0040401D24
MSISIRYPHSKPQEEARKLAEKVADEMSREFSMTYRWEGDVLHFERSGVTGQLSVVPGEVLVEAKLGFLLTALKPRIESEVRKFLNENFA